MSDLPIKAPLKANCPIHGVQEFIRVEAAAWWWCAKGQDELMARGHLGCKSVIPDELVTPDGAEVVVWDGYRLRRQSLS